MKLFHAPKGDITNYYQPDPFIFEWDGKFYVYATGAKGVQLYKSENFTDWEYKGILFSREGFKSYWAPCMMEKDGTFYLYFSAQPIEESDAHTQRLQVCTASSPEGPFTFEREICAPFSIDAHVVDTPEGIYLIYSTNDTDCARPGTLVMMDRMTDPLHVEGNPVVAVRATMDEEVHAFDRFKKGEHWHTIEGGCYYRRGDTHYLLYSGAGYVGDRYFVGYAVAHGEVDDLRKLEWKKYPDENTFYPLVFRTETLEGTGHNSLIDYDGDLWIVYHARERSRWRIPGVDTREMYANKVKIEGDKLSVDMNE